MNVLFTGKGTSGSWQIRGVQMAQALEAKAIPMASLDDCRRADVIVAVKRIPDALLKNIRASGTPWLWDCVDAYPQPECSAWNRTQSIAWAKREIERLQPDHVVWPNVRMKLDCEGGLVIPHHHRPDIKVNPIRDRIEVIGYEGAKQYVEQWLPAIERQCKRIGAKFVLNPESLADVDVVLALRGSWWNGYAQQHWKSNVKLANAHGSGTPFIGAPEDGYLETAAGAEYWATCESDLARALDWLESQQARRSVQQRFLKAALPIEKVADQYREVLCALRS